jgi:hypothetical protein
MLGGLALVVGLPVAVDVDMAMPVAVSPTLTTMRPVLKPRSVTRCSYRARRSTIASDSRQFSARLATVSRVPTMPNTNPDRSGRMRRSFAAAES